MTFIYLQLLASVLLIVVGLSISFVKQEREYRMLCFTAVFTGAAGLIMCLSIWTCKSEGVAVSAAPWVLLAYAVLIAIYTLIYFLNSRKARVSQSINLAEEIIENMMGGVLLLSPDGKIAYANRYCETLLSMSKERLSKLRFEDLALSAEQAGELLSLIREKGRVSCYEDPYELDIRLIAVLMGAISIGVSGTFLGEEAGYLLVLHDWRKKLRTELRQEERLREAESFLQIASHELRHPVTVLKATLPLLPRVLDDEKRRGEVLDLLEKGVENLNYMIADLLNASRIESGRFEINKREMCLDAMLMEILDEMRIKHEDREFVFRGEEADLLVKADKEKLRQILIILLENAVNYSESEVEIACGRRNGDVVLSVLDHGPGIPVDEQGRIFDRFYRSSSIARAGKGGGGLGLGLYIVKRILDEHGGSIVYQSRSGGGAEFRLTLPS
ncbi:MAG: ATP-binding protein [Actinomycetota bacterium]|nr:ATP-binding protein [Actinomycetota bacterium]